MFFKSLLKDGSICLYEVSTKSKRYGKKRKACPARQQSRQNS